MVTVQIPDEICFKEAPHSGTGETTVFMLLLAECIFCTVEELDLGRNKKVLGCTADFLAMGCPPVAPLSIITLAYARGLYFHSPGGYGIHPFMEIL